MKFYKLTLNYDTPLGEIEYRRTLKNYNLIEKQNVLDIVFDRSDFMSDAMAKGEFSLTDESEFLNILKVSHLEWDGLLLDDEIFGVFKRFKLQDFKQIGLSIFQDNDESNNKFVRYNLIHFRSNGARIKKIKYECTLKRSGDHRVLDVTYGEFINNEIDIPLNDRILRKINVLQVEVFNDFQTDLFFNAFLFKTDFIISENLLEGIRKFSGFKIEEGPEIIFVEL